MKDTLHIDGSQIHTLSDFYAMIEKTYACPYFGHNLDALSDVLTDASPKKIIIVANHALKKSLSKVHTRGITEYEALLDVFTDLDSEIIIRKDPNALSRRD